LTTASHFFPFLHGLHNEHEELHTLTRNILDTQHENVEAGSPTMEAAKKRNKAGTVYVRLHVLKGHE